MKYLVVQETQKKSIVYTVAVLPLAVEENKNPLVVLNGNIVNKHANQSGRLKIIF